MPVLLNALSLQYEIRSVGILLKLQYSSLATSSG